MIIFSNNRKYVSNHHQTPNILCLLSSNASAFIFVLNIAFYLPTIVDLKLRFLFRSAKDLDSDESD